MTDKKALITFDDSDGFNLAIILASMNRTLYAALEEYHKEHNRTPYAAVFDLLVPKGVEDQCLEEIREFGTIGMGKYVEKNGFHPLRVVFVYVGEEDECKAFNEKINDIIKAEYPSFGSEYMEIPL